MLLYLDLWTEHRIKTRVLVDYKIHCIDIAETQRQQNILKYSYLFSPVNSIDYLYMNAIRLRQDFSVRAMWYNLNI
jgi:hypothetical protein